MKAFNKTKAKKHIKMKQNKNTYIKTVSIVLACVILLVGIVLFTFAKFENNQEYTLINGQFGQYHMENCSYSVGKTWTYSYTGSNQSFSVPCSGTYKIELWGAQGGKGVGGNGGWTEVSGRRASYVSGQIDLQINEKMYVYVGQQGKDYTVSNNGGWNGGATSTVVNTGYDGGGGGGATDIRFFGSNYTPSSSELAWNSNLGLNSRIMVAAGGGGGRGTYGGGIYGYNYDGQAGTGSGTNIGASQTNGYKFGIGGPGSANYRAGSGGGYYGGYEQTESGGYYASSGSSYISGHTGCVAIAQGSTSNPRAVKISGCTSGTTDNLCSIHYSNKVFTDTIMIDGAGRFWTNTVGTESVGMPTTDGAQTELGHTGNGYAKITLTSLVGLIKD